ncbi:MAG: hypothetical protein ACK55I_07225, partial [bacterium]
MLQPTSKTTSGQRINNVRILFFRDLRRRQIHDLDLLLVLAGIQPARSLAGAHLGLGHAHLAHALTAFAHTFIDLLVQRAHVGQLVSARLQR